MSDEATSLLNEIDEMISSQLQRFALPGTWFNGEQRIGIAEVVRAARASGSQEDDQLSTDCLSEVEVLSTRKIAIDAHTIDRSWVEQSISDGLDELPFVELTAITAQLSALDTYRIGIGESPRKLPEPKSGEPAREKVKGAKINRGWLPTRGVAGAPNCFSAVADENKALMDIHSVIYLSMPEMMDTSIVKNLHRSQIELLAARTSNYNDCFY